MYTAYAKRSLCAVKEGHPSHCHCVHRCPPDPNFMLRFRGSQGLAEVGEDGEVEAPKLASLPSSEDSLSHKLQSPLPEQPPP